MGNVLPRTMLRLLIAGSLIGGFVLAPVGTPPADGAATQPGAAIQPDAAVEFVSSGVTIKASYRAPAAGVTGVPAAVIIGGTGNVDRDGNSPLAPGVAMDEYEWIADLLSAQGVASIRYDKVGTGETGFGPFTADPSEMLGLTYDQLRVQPARDALSFLAGQPGIDTTRLIVIGHSEGGAVTLALDNDPGTAPTPAGLALVAPSYGRILDVVKRQFVDQMQAAAQAGAMTPADVVTLTDWMQAGIDEIRAGDAPYPAPDPVPLPAATDYTAVMQTTIASNIYGSDPTQMVLTHSFRTRYGKEFDAIEPVALAARVTVPTLVICGTKDFNVPCTPGGPPGSGVSALAAAFAPGVADLVVAPNTVHIMRDVGDADPVGFAAEAAHPFSPAIASALSAFVAGFVATQPPAPTPTPVPRAAAPLRFTG